jgi:hypothetical protein
VTATLCDLLARWYETREASNTAESDAQLMHALDTEYDKACADLAAFIRERPLLRNKVVRP